MVLKDRAAYVSRWVFIGCITGVVAGPVAAAVWHGADWFLQGRVPFGWMYLMPIIGAAAAGIVVHSLSRVASGEGAPAYIASVNLRGGFVSMKLTVLYLLGFVLTAGTGGSGGLVGPTTLIGGGVGNAVGRMLRRFVPWLRLSRRDLNQVTICGAASGVGAVLGAPLGGGLFAVELLRADTIEYGCLFPAIVASAVGAGVGRMLGVHPIGWGIDTGPISAGDMQTALLTVLVTAVLVGVWGLAFVDLYRRASAIRHRVPYWLGPILGAGICVACTMAVRQPGLLGTSGPMLRKLFDNPAAAGLAVCCVVFVGKSLATVGTIGSGGNAGLTMPMLVIGGYLGAACVGISGLSGPAAQAVVAGGAAAMLSAVLNVPVASAVICIELFGADCAVAAALGSAVGFAVAKTEVVYSYWETRAEQ